MNERGRVLVVDDDRGMTDVLNDGLTRQGFRVETRASADEAFEMLQNEDFDVVVADLNLRGTNGLQLCERVVKNLPDVPVLVITAFGSLDTAIAAIRAGAYDFIPKPFDLEVLGLAVKRAIQHRNLRREVRRLRCALSSEGPGNLDGKSSAIRKVYGLVSQLANSTATVLLTGESGTGKERIARALHEQSPRYNGPFVAVDCASLPENLLESELFGHTSGAFTDAKTARKGLIAEANGGTLFFDEIGELPTPLQPKLLRALQERRVRPVGANTEVPIDARIIAATNRDLETEVEAGRFRKDLFYRINVVHIELPPLRVRGTDVLLLAQQFLRDFASTSSKQVNGFNSAAAERLLSYTWPGNVRELQNCIERAVAVARYDTLTVEDLPEKVRKYRAAPVIIESNDPEELLTMDEVERRYIRRVLDAVGGSKTAAARVLGFDRRTLYRKLARRGDDASDEA